MKKIRIALILILIFFLFVFGDSVNKKEKIEDNSNWNNGYCEIDGGRLNYKYVGSKYHYECDICHKEYVFNSVMSRRENK